ncbi:MAG: GNAT family N-acetyltransferase [Sediminibacterium sp.]|nr:GNAT family N-acetyltransferase [Sediminibacterium sp.]
MEIQNSTLEDVDFIIQLYRFATEYQKERFTSHWPEFDRKMVVNEILENRQWKMIIDGEVVCIWATTFSDPLIWHDKEKDPAVYIHRITTNPRYSGKGVVKKIVEWSKLYATQNGKRFVRMDTIGENLKSINHYTGCGFDFLGLSQLTNTDSLPQHYHNALVSLFELKV